MRAILRAMAAEMRAQGLRGALYGRGRDVRKRNQAMRSGNLGPIMRTLLGTINHASITVSDLDEAMKFFGPWLDFLGYTHHERGTSSGTRLTVNLNAATQMAFNVWEAKGELARHKFEVYEPG